MADILKGKLVASRVYDSAEPVTLRFELTNEGDKDLYVLKWYTPLEGLNSDCLTVLRNSKTKVGYDGPMIKRGNPGPDDYVLIPAGQTVTADVDVSESYSVSKPADYQVELNIPAVEHIPAPPTTAKREVLALAKKSPQLGTVRGGKTKFKVKKGPVQLPTRGEAARNVSESVAKARDEAEEAGGAAGRAAGPLPPIIVGGTAAQKAQARQAHNDGFRLCEAALAGLANDARYKEWFGAYSAARLKKVKAVYTKIRDRMRTVRFTYDLSGAGCKSGSFAYTYKGDTKIWFCGSFWSAPATGTDSKAGTVVHEHSHSDANTDDLTYGQTNARALAARAPDEAIRNADNYEYYAGG
jgi:peptidyl-Lys metalloendopeptidase